MKKLAPLSLSFLLLASCGQNESNKPAALEQKQPVANAVDDGNSYAGRIRKTASQKQFTAFADANHNDPRIRRLCVSEDTFKSLSAAGVKHIFAEMIYPEMKPVIDLYTSGGISRKSMEFYFNHFLPILNPQTAISKADQTAIYMDMIDNARKYGMKLHATDHHEGHYTPEELKIYAEYVCNFSLMVVRNYDQNPGRRPEIESNIGGFLQFIQQNFDQLFPDQVKSYLQMHQDRKTRLEGLAQNIRTNRDLRVETARQLQSHSIIRITDLSALEREPVDGRVTDMLVKGLYVLERMKLDTNVAQRIKSAAGSDKAAIIYGGRHFYRHEGDIDSGLGSDNVSTIRIFSSQHPLTPIYKSTEQKTDFGLDIDFGTWSEKQGTSVSIQMPAGFKPTTASAPAPSP